MDPITAALNVANRLLEFGEKVWDATPPDLQQKAAADWAQFNHNIASFVLGLQVKINAIVK